MGNGEWVMDNGEWGMDRGKMGEGSQGSEVRRGIKGNGRRERGVGCDGGRLA